MNSQMLQRSFRLVVVFFGLWFATDLISRLIAEVLWFDEVGYLQTFRVRLTAQVTLWTIVTTLSILFLLSNFALADRLKYDKPQKAISHSLPLSLRWLLLIAAALSILVGLILLHYGQVIAGYWQTNRDLLSVTPPLPPRLGWQTLWQILQPLVGLAERGISLWVQLGLLLLIATLLLIYPRVMLRTIAVLLSFCFGFMLAKQWMRVLLFLHPTSFEKTEPFLKRDISFYVFALPIFELLEFWLVGLFLFSLAAITLTYLLSGKSLSEGRFSGFSPAQQRHLLGLAGFLLLAIALHCWLNRYELLYSTRGVVYGAGYTDTRVELPAYAVLSVLAAIFAIVCWLIVLQGLATRQHIAVSPTASLVTQRNVPFRSRFLTYNFIAYSILALTTTQALPYIVQRFIVQPNELARELPYIRNSIALTRDAFNLDAVEVETFDPRYELTYADLQRNDLTIRNIRLWDTRPLLQTNRQLQQIRPYYRFQGADIDRYTLLSEDAPASGNTGKSPIEKQQVLIAARELDYSAVPQEAKTWVNQHLIYTHGYGFTLSPVNRVAPGGLPDYFVKDIGAPVEDVEETGAAFPTEAGQTGEITVSSDRILKSIPIGYPRIYYGELTNTYVMTGTRVQELDYPSGSENVYNTYGGRGGITISSPWRRWAFAMYLKDWQMLFTRDFTPETKVLFRREIQQRIQSIAPFLQYDQEPYLVSVDARGQAAPTGKPASRDENYLYWIVDAYTTSDRFPYSDPGDAPFNYIRNSVKVIIDAYHGSVQFYTADSQDPIIQSWATVFPEMFKPLDEMPPALRSHIRYPIDLFKIQTKQLLTYHMTDPQVFYNREDLWQIPNEIYGTQPQLVDPYYLITKLPTAKSEEFILLLPFRPAQRTNLVAWLAARSDGDDYGKLLLYQFPKQQLVYGTEQIEARINQDPVISQQISLWNRQGSRAVQGNLLVIPIEQSLLYVEPLYLEAEQNSLPTLARVIVAYENRIAMAETLEQALSSVFQPTKTSPAIVRPVEPPQ
jgi:uncharacterized protein